MQITRCSHQHNAVRTSVMLGRAYASSSAYPPTTDSGMSHHCLIKETHSIGISQTDTAKKGWSQPAPSPSAPRAARCLVYVGGESTSTRCPICRVNGHSAISLTKAALSVLCGVLAHSACRIASLWLRRPERSRIPHIIRKLLCHSAWGRVSPST